jgi:hypothetical protein
VPDGLEMPGRRPFPVTRIGDCGAGGAVVPSPHVTPGNVPGISVTVINSRSGSDS